MRGFTLVELLLVLAILGALAAIPAAHFDSADARLDAAALALAADLQSAREEALVGGRSSGIRFEPDGKSYTLHVDFEGASENPPTWRRTLFAGQVSALDLRRPLWVVFAPDGGLESGGSIELALGAERRRLRLHGASGSIWVTEP